MKATEKFIGIQTNLRISLFFKLHMQRVCKTNKTIAVSSKLPVILSGYLHWNVTLVVSTRD